MLLVLLVLLLWTKDMYSAVIRVLLLQRQSSQENATKAFH